MCYLTQVPSIDIRKMVYLGYFQSIMSYGIIIWGHCNEWKTIFKLQKKMVRVMVNAPYRESCKPIFKKLNILTFPSLYLYELICHLHCNIENCNTIQEPHCYETRYKQMLKFPIHRLSLFEHNSLYMGIKVYNKFSVEMETLNTQNFKIKLKTWLLNKAYYSVKEYIEEYRLIN
ncbi:hypothetical protein C0J52_16845 [Blattella germanica]|nr:hypothetical protein C0J52_16845 [Blattella germanica]